MAQTIHPSAQLDTTKSAPRKPYVRILTDKRREQNRRAQKAYRERLKKKLEALEEHAASTLVLGPEDDVDDVDDEIEIDSDGLGGNAGDGRTETVVDAISTRSTPTSGGSAGRTISPATIVNLSSAATTTPSAPYPKVINLADAFAAAGDLPFTHGSALPGIQFHMGQPSPELEVIEEIEHTHHDYGDLDLRTIWTLPPDCQPCPTPPWSSHSSNSSLTLTPRRTPNGYPHPPWSAVADPYTNHMHLLGENHMEASLAVGLLLNITRSQYINEHPSHFPACYVALNRPDPRSPTTSIARRTVTYKMANKFMDITPELKDHLEELGQAVRPTPAQLLHPHPTYLDCIVFPHVREVAVKASADGVLDHPSLFRDLMDGGMICWGGRSGLTNRHGRSTKSAKRDMRDSVAWSPRSWEAKRWFLQKWAWLIGTEDDEEARGDPDGIWRASRWWWAMRGEDDSDYEDSDEQVSSGERFSELDPGEHCF